MIYTVLINIKFIQNEITLDILYSYISYSDIVYGINSINNFLKKSKTGDVLYMYLQKCIYKIMCVNYIYLLFFKFFLLVFYY